MDPTKPVLWPAWVFAALSLATMALVLVAEFAIDSWADGVPCTVRVVSHSPIAGPGGSIDGYTVTVVGIAPPPIESKRYTYRTEMTAPVGTTLDAVYRPGDVTDVLASNDHRRGLESPPAARWALFAVAALYLAGFARWFVRTRRARQRASARAV